MEEMPKLHRTEFMLLGLVSAAIVVGIVLWLVFRNSEPTRVPPTRLSVSWELVPRWGSSPAQVNSVKGNPQHGRLAIYLDRSLPMLGFVAPADSSKRSGLESVVRLLPDHLARINGGAVSHLSWHSIAEKTERLATAPSLTRAFLSGGESRLDLAVTEIVGELARGTVEAAALVTDLIATGELTGAQGTAQALSEWTHSPAVLSGHLDLGLLAVKAPYWGVRAGSCPAPAGDVGCWFSEQAQRFLPLPEVRPIPFYVLVFTRGREATQKVLDGLEVELKELGHASEWEVLTDATAAKRPPATECTVHAVDDPANQQFALFGADNGRLSCERSESVRLSCALPEGIVSLEPAADANSESLSFSSHERTLEVELDCRAQRERESEFSLDLKLIGALSPQPGERWASWSSTTDDDTASLGKTLRLQLFVERLRLRPDSYTVTAHVVSPGADRGR